MVIKNKKLYDRLKFLALVLLPAAGTLYFAVDQAWGLGYGSKVVGTIVAVDTFLGGFLHISSQTYNNSDAKFDGTMNVTGDASSKSFSLELNGDPHDLDQQDSVTFKVNKQTPMQAKVTAKRTPAKKPS
jgi:Putative phage holin Dp-1